MKFEIIRKELCEIEKELDRLVAEKIMGWELSYTVGYPVPHTLAYKDDEGKIYRGFSPSTNIQDAWIVLDKVCKQHNRRAIIDRNQTETWVTFKNQMGACSQHFGIDESPMMAICYACLETVGIEIESGTV